MGRRQLNSVQNGTLPPLSGFCFVSDPDHDGQRLAAHSAAGRPAHGELGFGTAIEAARQEHAFGTGLQVTWFHLRHSPLRCYRPQDCDLHPTEGLLASGVIDGHVALHSFSKEAPPQLRHKLKVGSSRAGQPAARR